MTSGFQPDLFEQTGPDGPCAGPLALRSPALFLEALTAAVRAGQLGELPLAFARLLAQQAPDASPELLLAAALLSHQVGQGHVALDVRAVLKDPRATLALRSLRAGQEGCLSGEVPETHPLQWLQGLTVAGWLAHMQHPALVAQPGAAMDAGCGENSAVGGATPLVLTHQGGRPRLYLRRYWQYEQDVRAALAWRLQPWGDSAASASTQERLRHVLDALFPAVTGRDDLLGRGPDWQKLACALATRLGLAVITGGPGTGKTTTVVRLLALLQSLALGEDGQGRPLRIRLAAPTGKAAARLNEAISKAVGDLGQLDIPHALAVREHIPVRVSTLHRLLGRQPHRRQFRHHAGQPLPVDVLVVDEASMVDLDVMAALLAALPPSARLILLGDREQLASVEAGAVLGELCERAAVGHYWPSTQADLLALSGDALPDSVIDSAGLPLDQAVIMLRHSHRFQANSGIGRLAQAVNQGDSAALAALRAHPTPDLAFLRPDQWESWVLNGPAGDGSAAGPVGYAHYLRVMHSGQPSAQASRAEVDAWAAQVLQAQGQFQLLCAVREGPWGVAGQNQRVMALLQRHGLINAPLGAVWYAGRPVLVTANDDALGLVNGDVGMVLRCPAAAMESAGAGPGSAPLTDSAWVLRVAFLANAGEKSPEGGSGAPALPAVRWVLPARLPGVESVYAMTVHKSQGSEFDHTGLVLPPTMNPVMTRELLYTGITRAKRWFSLMESAGPDHDVLLQASRRRVQRAGGLLALPLEAGSAGTA